jgi:hypothetical protein
VRSVGNRLTNIAAAVLVSVAALLGGCASVDPPRPAPTASTPLRTAATGTSSDETPTDATACDLPAAIAIPEWVPEDLPLPAQTYAYDEGQITGGYHSALFIIPMSTDEFGEFVRSEWPAAGYVLGRGDSEPWEVEASFGKPPGIGAFKANLLDCTPPKATLALRYSPSGLATATPSTKP